jgi:hypothetical protein
LLGVGLSLSRDPVTSPISLVSFNMRVARAGADAGAAGGTTLQ